MRGRGRRGYYRAGRGGRGSPESTNAAQASGDPLFGRGGGRGGRGADYSRGRPRGRGRGSTSPGPQDQQLDIDERMVDASDGTLNASPGDAQVALQGPAGVSPPLRPDFGTDGTHITLCANFFPVRMPQGPLFEYHVNIVPAVFRTIRRRVFHLAEQTAAWRQAGMHGNAAHDSHERLVSVPLLPQPLTIAVPYYAEGETGPPEDGTVYTLSISLVRQISMEDLTSYLAGQSDFRNYNALPVITALNTILTSISKKVDVEVWRGRYFSAATAEPTRFGGALEAWRGFQPILKPVYKQLMVRVGITTSAFHVPGNLARAMADFNQFSFGARMDAFFRGVRVKTTHLGHRKIVRKIVPHTARRHSIDTLEYGHVTVEDYFRQKYNLRLQYLDLPLVDVGGKNPTYLPAEVCDILSGQPSRRGLWSERAVAMSATGRRPSEVNRTAIINMVRNQLGPDQTRPELRSFGMTIGQDMLVIPGRILPKPGIEYLSGAALINDGASWNLKGVKFAVGAHLKNWAVLVINEPWGESLSSEDQDLRREVARFCDMCNACGMHVIDNPKYSTAQLPRRDLSDPLRRTAIDAIRNALLNINPKPTLFLVMLASEDRAVYDDLKHLCDVFLDVATVCVQSRKFRSSNLHYLANVALKVNMKLGGINHKLDPKSKTWLNQAPTMIVGIHVTHPSPNAAGTPSVAAVVASVDNNFAQYPAKLEIQQTKVELVTDLKNMMVDRLRLFREKNNGKLPERIIVYRSGVSKSLARQIREVELPLMLEAFRTFRSDAPYRPKITIIICSKCHQTRFYPTDVKSTGSGGNPIPGAVVDRGVTAIYDFDFFLQSHDALSGTARPMHYCVIHDEIGFKADTLQGVTHSLSYMFARATKAVRLVSPAYYAELASRRGRCYLRGLNHLGLGAALNKPAEQDVMQEAQRVWGGGVWRPALRNTMFYL